MHSPPIFRAPSSQDPAHISEILPDVLARYGIGPAAHRRAALDSDRSAEYPTAPTSFMTPLTDLLLPLSLS